MIIFVAVRFNRIIPNVSGTHRLSIARQVGAFLLYLIRLLFIFVSRIVRLDLLMKRKPELPADSFCSGLQNKLVMNNYYYDLLNNRLWKRKRAYILYRDGHMCTVCGSKLNLQVHHTFYYIPDTLPWLYPNDSLLTLCENCHEDYHRYHENEYRTAPKKKKVKVLREKIVVEKQIVKKYKKRKSPKKLSLADVQRLKGSIIYKSKVW
jgi:hypothetical protein